MRNTIRKYLKSGAVEPTFATPERPSKLDPFAEKLSGWLKAEAGKGRKQRRTLKQLHADLVALGFTGSYNRVAAFAREWRAGRQRQEQTAGRGTFVPLLFQPGEAFQFDWSEDYAVIGGERAKLQVAHIKLSHSRAFLLRAYPARKPTRCCSTPTGAGSASSAASLPEGSTTARPCSPLVQEQWSSAHGGGPCGPRQAAPGQRPVHGHGEPLRLRADLLQSGVRLGLRQCGATGSSPLAQSQVEKGVQDARPRLWQLMPAFPDLDALNAWLEERCIALWRETEHGGLPGAIADVWAAEQAALMPLPPAFDGFVEMPKRVSPTCLITFERNRVWRGAQ